MSRGISELFSGSKHAEIYAQFRPEYPKELYEYLVTVTQEKISEPLQLAVDVGCGTGTSTRGLAPYFKKVFGIDVSEAQIEQAKKRTRDAHVSYIVGPSEQIPVEPSSVDLITAAAAFHWFDIPKFYEECQRVLRPGGVMAAYAYQLPTLIDPDPHVTKVLNEEHCKFCQSLPWSGRIKLIHEEYENQYNTMPFKEKTKHDGFTIKQDNISIDSYVQFVETWSSYQTLLKADPNTQALADLKEKMTKTVTIPNQISAHFHVFLIYARKTT